MRCYHLSNMYLSSIQQGIQSAHAQMELFVKYDADIVPGYMSVQKTNLFTWAKEHKTMIVLNGGYVSHMQEALEFLSKESHPYPFAPFYESDDALGGILTNIAIVLPEKIYVAAELIRNGKVLPEYNRDHILSINTTNAVEFSEIDTLLKTFGVFTSFELELCMFLNKFRLAN